MDQISSKYDLEPMFTKFNRMYLMSYNFIFMFLATFTEKKIISKIDVQSDQSKGIQRKTIVISITM